MERRGEETEMPAENQHWCMSICETVARVPGWDSPDYTGFLHSSA